MIPPSGTESAWERGLRSAKAVRIRNKYFQKKFKSNSFSFANNQCVVNNKIKIFNEKKI